MAVTFKVILSDKAKKDETYPVLLRITLDRRTIKPSLSIYVKKAHFKPDGSYDKANWIKTTPDQDLYNRQIKAVIRQVRTYITQSLEQNVAITLNGLKAIVQQKEYAEITLSDYFIKWAQQYKNHKPATYELYNQSLDRLTEYNQGSALYFNQVNKKFIEGFVNWLTTEYVSASNKKKPGISTAGLYLSKLKAVFNQAVKDNIIKYENNPFIHYKIKKGKSKPKDILTPAEINLLEQIELPFDSKEWHARNIILCQYYALGSRIVDMLLLEFSFIKNARLEFEARKTKKDQSIKLHEQLLTLLGLYEYRRGHRFIFPYLDPDLNLKDATLLLEEERKHTREISRVAQKIIHALGIKKKISTHVLRHSFTSNALTADNNLLGISRALQHGDTKTIEDYSGQITNQLIDQLTDRFYKNKNFVVEMLPDTKNKE